MNLYEFDFSESYHLLVLVVAAPDIETARGIIRDNLMEDIAHDKNNPEYPYWIIEIERRVTVEPRVVELGESGLVARYEYDG